MITNVHLVVPRGADPERLDKFIQSRYPDLSRSAIHRSITKGLVLVGGKMVRKGDLVRQGDEILIKEISAVDEAVVIPNPDIPVKILYEDKDVLVVDKPARIPTHPLVPEETNTLANVLIARYPELAKVGDAPLEPGLVHRLDNETSGVMVVARSPRAYDVLREEFTQEKIKKEYLALVMGEVMKEGKLETAIAHHPENPKKMEVVTERDQIVRLKARRAYTRYEVQKRFVGYTLLKVTIKTGVMHQIRVHLASIDHPLAGDRLYQRSRFRKTDSLGLTRHFLHAARIGFYHPNDRRWLEFFSALPDDLASVLTTLPSK